VDEEQDGPRPEASFGVEHRLAQLEALYEHTKNPLFVWEAISMLQVNRRRRLGVELSLPGWTQDYIGEAAVNILLLLNGSKVDPGMEMRAPDAETALVRVGEAFGFVRELGKASAFRDYRKSQQHLRAARQANFIKAAGLRGRAAHAAMKEELPTLTDRSAMQKRIVKGQKLMTVIRNSTRARE
jgi:hypothetical protein